MQINYNDGEYEKEPLPLLSEVEKTIKDMNCHMSTGIDEIPAGLWKCVGEEGVKALHHLYRLDLSS